MHSDERNHIIIAGLIGAIAGGAFVAALTNAIPKMMEEISSTMMGKMMAQMRGRMGEQDCTPEEM
jgi:hypothetical protein